MKPGRSHKKLREPSARSQLAQELEATVNNMAEPAEDRRYIQSRFRYDAQYRPGLSYPQYWRSGSFPHCRGEALRKRVYRAYQMACLLEELPPEATDDEVMIARLSLEGV